MLSFEDKRNGAMSARRKPLDCGCEVEDDSHDWDSFEPRIVFCPLHGAASDLLEAAKAVYGGSSLADKQCSSFIALEKAIAKAEKEKT